MTEGKPGPEKWVELVAAPNQLTAEMWCELLRGEGIPAQIEPRDVVTFLGISPFPVRILVPAGMEAEARAVLDESPGE